VQPMPGKPSGTHPIVKSGPQPGTRTVIASQLLWGPYFQVSYETLSVRTKMTTQIFCILLVSLAGGIFYLLGLLELRWKRRPFIPDKELNKFSPGCFKMNKRDSE
jgi:hypothetical protein